MIDELLHGVRPMEGVAHDGPTAPIQIDRHQVALFRQARDVLFDTEHDTHVYLRRAVGSSGLRGLAPNTRLE